MVRRGPHAGTAIWAFGGAPYGATILVRGLLKQNSMRGRDACGHRHLGLRWSSLRGHETREGCALLCGSDAAGGATGAFGGAPYGATKRARGVPKWMAGAHAGTAGWAFGGAPCGATKRVRGVPKREAGTRAGTATWAFGGAPMGPRNV